MSVKNKDKKMRLQFRTGKALKASLVLTLLMMGGQFTLASGTAGNLFAKVFQKIDCAIGTAKTANGAADAKVPEQKAAQGIVCKANATPNAKTKSDCCAPDSEKLLEIPEKELQQIKAFSQNILAQFPPQKYIYVGLGRSPTPIIAFLKAQAQRDPNIEALNLPLSGFRPSLLENKKKYNDRFKDLKNIIFDDSLAKDKRAKLFSHFSKFLLEQSRGRGKTLLLIDYVESGRSLIAAKDHLTAFLEEMKKGKVKNADNFQKIEALGVHQKMYQERLMKAPLHDSKGEVFHHMTLEDYSLGEGSFAEKIGNSYYDDLAEFTAFYPTHPSSDPLSLPPVKREIFDRYVEKMAKSFRPTNP